jgi:hypothetical protein
MKPKDGIDFSSGSPSSIKDVQGPDNRKFLGLLRRKNGWTLTLRGWVIAISMFVLLGISSVNGLYPFLSLDRRVASRVLVIDGWMPTYDLEKAADIFRQGRYDTVVEVRGVYSFDSAELTIPWDDYVGSILIRHGIPRSCLKSVLFPGLKRDRTFTSALAVKEWFQQNRLPLANLNLVTVGAHARRSRLLYEMALGDKVEIGVIGLDDPAYDTNHWWRSSEGIHGVLFEGVAYLYVRFIFSPPKPIPIQLLGPST